MAAVTGDACRCLLSSGRESEGMKIALPRGSSAGRRPGDASFGVADRTVHAGVRSAVWHVGHIAVAIGADEVAMGRSVDHGGVNRPCPLRQRVRCVAPQAEAVIPQHGAGRLDDPSRAGPGRWAAGERAGHDDSDQRARPVAASPLDRRLPAAASRSGAIRPTRTSAGCRRRSQAGLLQGR